MTTTKRTTAETLDERAERVAREAAEVGSEREALAREEADRLDRHRAEVDAETVDTYDRKAFDAEVDQAKADLDRAIAEHPLTQALSRFYAAQARRRQALETYISARGRQGHDIAGVTYPMIQGVDLIEQMTRAAERSGTEARLALEAEFYNRYNDNEETPCPAATPTPPRWKPTPAPTSTTRYSTPSPTSWNADPRHGSTCTPTWSTPQQSTRTSAIPTAPP